MGYSRTLLKHRLYNPKKLKFKISKALWEMVKSTSTQRNLRLLLDPKSYSLSTIYKPCDLGPSPMHFPLPGMASWPLFQDTLLHFPFLLWEVVSDISQAVQSSEMLQHLSMYNEAMPCLASFGYDFQCIELIPPARLSTLRSRLPTPHNHLAQACPHIQYPMKTFSLNYPS